ncbi:autophagy protein atg9 [Ascosphaera acerosa]|nr:autophagy protein atg9 [Ascosphaera acerosa]
MIPSIYEAIQRADDDLEAATAAGPGAGPSERGGAGAHAAYTDLDEENLTPGGPYRDDELAGALADADLTVTPEPDTTRRGVGVAASKTDGKGKGRYGGGNQLYRDHDNHDHYREDDDEDDDDNDNEVPASLLVDRGQDLPKPLRQLPPRRADVLEHMVTVSDADYPASRTQATALPRWRTPETHAPRPAPSSLAWRVGGADPRARAMWRWTNVENLDNFLKDVYDYFRGNGLQSVCLRRCLNLLTAAFVVGFSTFLANCIDYRAVPRSKSLSEVMLPRCAARMSGWSNVLVWVFSFLWVVKAIQYAMDVARLWRLRDFYLYLLGVSDADTQSISWQEVVSRLMALRELNPTTAQATPARHRKFIGSQSKERMDAQDIANRLMRKENYLIALFNKDILDLTLPLPLLRNRQLFSRTLEWNLNICILDFVFNEQGQVRPIFLKETHRRVLSEALRRRFIVIGILNIFIAPFLVAYFLTHHFFRYFSEYHKNPALVGARQYTPLAEWRFREFNELWHLFQRRLNMSYPFASMYVDQFPKDKTVQLARFVSFVAGAIASVLALASVIDPELFLGFEITPDRTVLFYLGLFGSVWAGARGMVPEKTLVFDPEYAIREVISYTHYLPSHWKHKLHSDDVKREFALLYQMKVVVFLQEILSMIIAPLVLCFSLPRCSEQIIDFFREFTIHVDGLGYICSFAEFAFQKGTGPNAHVQTDASTGAGAGGKADPRSDYYSTKDNKMLASYFGFLDAYGDAPGRPGNYRHQRQHHLARHTELQEGSSRSVSRAPASSSSQADPVLSSVHRGTQPLIYSTLLDPHHQPSASAAARAAQALRRPPPTASLARQPGPLHHSQQYSAYQDMGDASSRMQSPLATKPDPHPVETDASWRVYLDQQDDMEGGPSGDDEDDVQDLQHGQGVIGLVRQLQKAVN